MKPRFIMIVVLLCNTICAQSKKDLLLQKNILSLVEEMEFMYGYDQTLREYTIFKTFNKSETDSLEKLPKSILKKEISKRQFESDSIGIHIWKNYITPKDSAHTKRMIEITKTYGFPSLKRIKKYYTKEFIDPEFNPYILLIHAPKKYWPELKILMKNEFDIGRINRCTYGHLLWHLTGRKSFKPMLENGYEMVEKNNVKTLKSTCE